MKFLSRFFVMMLAVGATVPVQAAEAESARPAPKPTRIVNRVAAVVNGRPITSSEVRARLRPYVNELLMLYPQQGGRFNGELVKAKKAVLDELIERELVLSDFEGKGLQMPSNAIEEEINRRILVHFNGKREALLENLRASGMTLSEYRDSVRKEVTVGAMRSMRYDRDIPPTPDEIRAEYQTTKYDYRDMTKDSVRYKKIFIPMGGTGDPNATVEEQYQFAVELAEGIKKGEISFEDAAMQWSRDEYAPQGGQWPFRCRCDLDVQFANIVFSLPKNQVSGPLASPYGFTIVCVQETKRATPPSLNSPGLKARVDDSVRRKKSEQRYREWVKRLRDKAVIRVYI